MDRPENKARLKKIKQLLTELTMGNVFKRIERTDSKDELETIMALANMVAEDLNVNMAYRAHINPNSCYSCTLQLFFVLDAWFKIEKTGSGVKRYLYFYDKELFMAPFESILDPDSQKQWARASKEIAGTSRPESNLWLTFRTKTGLLLPAYCTVIRLGPETSLNARYIITSSHVIKTKNPVEVPYLEGTKNSTIGPKIPSKRKKRLYFPDIGTIRNIAKYVTDHLDGPLPNLKDLAHQFGTNENKLKNGFRELYGMTVFQYQKEQRLRKAYALIKLSDIPIHMIATLVGFKKSNHLSREFKIKYGYSPSEIR